MSINVHSEHNGAVTLSSACLPILYIIDCYLTNASKLERKKAKSKCTELQRREYKVAKAKER